MLCLKCGVEYEERRGDLIINDDFVGSYSVSSATWKECPECGRRLFNPQTLERMEAERQRTLDSLLRQRPIGDFLTATETAALLGISRQALHKHRRIRRGFIYSIRRNGKTEYLKESVLLYKKTGDGRFSLVKADEGFPKYVDLYLTSDAGRFLSNTESLVTAWQDTPQLNIHEGERHVWQH